MANEQHIEWLQEGVEAWNARRLQDDFVPDLSGADLSGVDLSGANLSGANLSGANLTDANLSGANLSGANLTDANLSGANLSGANLNGADLNGADLNGADLNGADLNGAYFNGADLNGAYLTGADLTGADLTSADLPGVILADANLTSANLTSANLIGANLAEADLAEADLTGADLTNADLTNADLTNADLTNATFTNAILDDKARFIIADSVRIAANITKPITEVETLLSEINTIENYILNQEQSMRLYFRGEPCIYDSLMPSVARKDSLVNHESEMLRDLMSRRPEEFADRLPAITQWGIAQHHGLHTRLLDITRNSLVALFFACESNEKSMLDVREREHVNVSPDGRVHVFAVPGRLIKQYDSDAISIISNFFRLRRDDQDAILEGPDTEKEKNARYRLIQLIQIEKPYFEDRINKDDLRRVFIVEPQHSSQRIRAQESAYIVSARHLRFEPEEVNPSGSTPKIDLYRHYTLTVPDERKPGLLKTLKNLGFTRERLFPGLVESAQAVNQEYADRARTGEASQE